MRLYQTYFSFEFSEGGNTAVYPTITEARLEAVRILKERMQELLDTADRLDIPEIDRGISEGYANISIVELPPITKETMCQIINSSGGSYVRSERAVMTITLPAGAKRPIIKRSGQAPEEEQAHG